MIRPSLIFTSGNTAAATPTEPELKDQVPPTSESGSQPAKRAGAAAKAKQQLRRQQHSRKPFQKMNGTSKGPSSKSTVPSVPKAQVSARPQESSQPDGEAGVIRKLKRRRPKPKPSQEATVSKHRAPPNGVDPPAVLPPSENSTAPGLKDCSQSLGITKTTGKGKQQIPGQPAKRAASLKEDGAPKGPSVPTGSPHSSTRPPPAKRRKSVTKGSSQPQLS